MRKRALRVIAILTVIFLATVFGGVGKRLLRFGSASRPEIAEERGKWFKFEMSREFNCWHRVIVGALMSSEICNKYFKGVQLIEGKDTPLGIVFENIPPSDVTGDCPIPYKVSIASGEPVLDSGWNIRDVRRSGNGTLLMTFVNEQLDGRAEAAEATKLHSFFFPNVVDGNSRVVECGAKPRAKGVE